MKLSGKVQSTECLVSYHNKTHHQSGGGAHLDTRGLKAATRKREGQSVPFCHRQNGKGGAGENGKRGAAADAGL